MLYFNWLNQHISSKHLSLSKDQQIKDFPIERMHFWSTPFDLNPQKPQNRWMSNSFWKKWTKKISKNPSKGIDIETESINCHSIDDFLLLLLVKRYLKGSDNHAIERTSVSKIEWISHSLCSDSDYKAGKIQWNGQRKYICMHTFTQVPIQSLHIERNEIR